MRGNFDYTENATVMDVIRQSAKRINREYDKYSEYEDLVQECHIFLSTKADLQEAVTEENYGLLQYRLEADLKNLLDAEVRRTEKNVSYDGLLESSEDGGEYLMSNVVIETASNDYSRESVESLLPAVWDDSLVYGLPQKDTAPDPDMPKGASNKAHANNLAAYIADIKFGWEKTPLTDKERRALLLAYGFGWTQKEIAFNQGVTPHTISHRIETAVGKIVARLNGGYYYDVLGAAA